MGSKKSLWPVAVGLSSVPCGGVVKTCSKNYSTFYDRSCGPKFLVAKFVVKSFQLGLMILKEGP